MRSLDLGAYCGYNIFNKGARGDFMSLYKELYFKLFVAVTDAVEDMEQAN